MLTQPRRDGYACLLRLIRSRRFLLLIFGGSRRTLPTGADEAGGTAVKFYELRGDLELLPNRRDVKRVRGPSFAG